MLHVISCVTLCGTYNFIHKFLCGSAVNDPIGFDKCFRCMISPGIDTSQIVTRCLFPSPARAAFCEQYTLRNAGPITVAVELNPVRDEVRTDADAGVEGSYTLIAATDFVRSRTLRLAPGETCVFGASVRGLKTPEVEQPLDISAERAQREAFVAEVCGNLSLESPEPVLNTMFALAKVRAAESVFRTRGGLLHAPGGVYYAAIW